MNLILLFKNDFTGDDNAVRLSGRRYRHITEIHRASVGDELCVGLANGNVGSGKVTVIGMDFLEMDVRLDRRPPEKLPLTLVLAMPRPIALGRILAAVAAMGVGKVALIGSGRVEKSYWQSPVLNEEKIKEHLILGLEQARDTVMPEVIIRKLFKPFVEDELPDIIKGTMPIAAHPEAETACPRSEGSPVTLAVGPEGGFLPYESEKLRQTGFSLVTIGNRILKVETAIPYIISRLF